MSKLKVIQKIFQKLERRVSDTTSYMGEPSVDPCVIICWPENARVASLIGISFNLAPRALRAAVEQATGGV